MYKRHEGRLRASAQRGNITIFGKIYKSIIHKLTEHKYSCRPQTEEADILQMGKSCWQRLWIKPYQVFPKGTNDNTDC